MDPTLIFHTLDVGPFGFMDYGSSGANGTAQPKPDPNTAHLKLNWACSWDGVWHNSYYKR